MAAVRPPAYGTIRVCDQPAASVLRVVTGWHCMTSAQMFQPVPAGWVGIEPATVVMVEVLLTYVKQLGHGNPRVLDIYSKRSLESLHEVSRWYALLWNHIRQEVSTARHRP